MSGGVSNEEEKMRVMEWFVKERWLMGGSKSDRIRDNRENDG